MIATVCVFPPPDAGSQSPGSAVALGPGYVMKSSPEGVSTSGAVSKVDGRNCPPLAPPAPARG